MKSLCVNIKFTPKMDSKEILNFCLEKGILLDKEILSLFSEANDIESVKLIIEKIKNHTQQKIITKKLFNKNIDQVDKFFRDLPEGHRKKLENLKIKLGVSIEISRHESDILNTKKKEIPVRLPEFEKPKTLFDKDVNSVKVISSNNIITKKFEVNDFVKYFRNRFSEMRDILQEHSELNNLVSINKILEKRQGISIIGLVSEKRITKNKNIMFEVEDLTGKIRVLVKNDKKELYKKAEEIALDSVIGFKGSGGREIFFVNDISFPESMILERKKSPVEEYALFIGDLHLGSKLFLEENFLKFIDYLNGRIPNTPEISKIKYLFIAGDLITGVGNYPNQEEDLKIVDIEEQFIKVADLLSRIRNDITIIISPGNHEGVRLMEPQPLFDEKYAWPLYNLKNVILVGNPARVNIGARENFSGFDVLIYHGFSFPFYADNIPKLMLGKAMNNPERIMAYLLKNRHLAPTHASIQYFPSEKDSHLIQNVPDIFLSAHTHKNAVSYYNNILMISTSCWESMTPYQEKFGNEPDHCKVPMFNLKTRAIKILDFE